MCPSKRFHAIDLEALFHALARRQGAVWIDRDETGKRSFMAFHPVAQLRIDADEKSGSVGDPLKAIANFVGAVPPLGDDSGFVPHIAGFLAYDLGRWVEPRSLGGLRVDRRNPIVLLERYDAVAVLEPCEGDAEQPGGAAAVDPARSLVDLYLVGRDEAALQKWERCLAELAEPTEMPPGARHDTSTLTSRPCREAHEAMLRQALERIADGEVYEVNLASRFQARSTLSPAKLYWRLRHQQAVRFGVYFASEAATLLCRSPERFLRIEGDLIRTEPIKGTRPRAAQPAEDDRLAEELLSSAKERAEHVMVVDLERNDLGRVCATGSVSVPSFARMEEFATVRHLVSTVAGQLRPEVTLPDILRATFPGGSITGAPRLRAMQTIDQLEEEPRGIYTGCMFWMSSARQLDSCIVIRSALAHAQDAESPDSWLWEYAVGGGIVADSEPTAEVDELWWKARSFLDALGVSQDERANPPSAAAASASAPASASGRRDTGLEDAASPAVEDRGADGVPPQHSGVPPQHSGPASRRNTGTP